MTAAARNVYAGGLRRRPGATSQRSSLWSELYERLPIQPRWKEHQFASGDSKDPIELGLEMETQNLDAVRRLYGFKGGPEGQWAKMSPEARRATVNPRDLEHGQFVRRVGAPEA